MEFLEKVEQCGRWAAGSKHDHDFLDSEKTSGASAPPRLVEEGCVRQRCRDGKKGIALGGMPLMACWLKRLSGSVSWLCGLGRLDLAKAFERVVLLVVGLGDALQSSPERFCGCCAVTRASEARSF